MPDPTAVERYTAELAHVLMQIDVIRVKLANHGGIVRPSDVPGTRISPSLLLSADVAYDTAVEHLADAYANINRARSRTLAAAAAVDRREW